MEHEIKIIATRYDHRHAFITRNVSSFKDESNLHSRIPFSGNPQFSGSLKFLFCHLQDSRILGLNIVIGNALNECCVPARSIELLWAITTSRCTKFAIACLGVRALLAAIL